MCEYYDDNYASRRVMRERRTSTDPYVSHNAGQKNFRTRYKRTRVKCPACGRKMIGWDIIHDGEVLAYSIPKHKRKKWWKKT